MICKIMTLTLLLQCYLSFCFVRLLFCFGLVFKVIAIEESGFVEKTNLRVGRINLNFSITDVQWHPVDGKYSFSI